MELASTIEAVIQLLLETARLQLPEQVGPFPTPTLFLRFLERCV